MGMVSVFAFYCLPDGLIELFFLLLHLLLYNREVSRRLHLVNERDTEREPTHNNMRVIYYY